jgi:uncharacterized protein
MHRAPASFLIVSLHDVSLQTWVVCREILRDLEEVGVDKVSLLVIPDHHRRGHFLQDRAFCEWLQEMEKWGHEIVTHGYFHQRERRDIETARDKMITRFYTADEGEFYDLSGAEAARKMEQAQADFATLGIEPVGFIAPAWLLSRESEVAACKVGFRYTTTLQEIRTLPGSHRSQSLVYSVRSGWRRVVSIGWNRFLLARLERNPVARLGIHPPDWKYPAIRREILRLAKYLTSQRTAMTYAEWTAR